ncbi:hypothetical protein [Chitinophaga caseinilytica]|uniref:VCBS repeat-containing protein n=1 Tax=Chitinophaga caseinilytica TaxID=2267521 RepID=A0ABZ2YWE8_9BACT
MKQLVIVQKIIRTTLILSLFFSCKNPSIDNTQNQSTTIVQKINKDSLVSKLNDNLQFIGDSLLNDKTLFIKDLVNKYQHDTCGFIAYEDSMLKTGFEGVNIIGDIIGNKRNDTVFVLPTFNYCEDGDSYYFFDTSLPRLYTDSYCCHPDNLFPIGDIDEDGISEICIFYSSCASRFKSLIAYSLKKKTWKEIGRCTFDINFMEPDKEKRVRKRDKGKFEMLEIVDEEENKKWIQFSF